MGLDRMSDAIAVNEIYGPVFQGEGKNIGMPCVFMRLAGCNLACSWCDSRFSWDWQQYDPKQEIHRMTVAEIFDRLEKSQSKNLVVTGGEPMLQQKQLFPLLVWLKEKGWWVEIETAGTIPIWFAKEYDLVGLYTVSIKTASSGNELTRSIQPVAIESFVESGKAVFKFVVSKMSDFTEIDELVSTYKLKPVYIMPEGVDAAGILSRSKELAGEVIKRGYHLTTRLHVLLYGSRRGV